jgi:hypothetical protein
MERLWEGGRSGRHTRLEPRIQGEVAPVAGLGIELGGGRHVGREEAGLLVK